MKKYFEKIYKNGFATFEEDLKGLVESNKKTFIVTANPETLMLAKENAELDGILMGGDTLITPDGIGVVKAAGMLGFDVKERVTGVETAQSLLRILNSQKKSLYLFGAKREVLEKLVEKIKNEHPDILIAGYEDGYASDKDAAFEKIAECAPDAVLVALGIPQQELLIARHIDKFSKGIFVGVGGSFDVMSGSKKRAPEIFIRFNLEWLYRILREPKRIKRFYNSNIKFIAEIRRIARRDG